MDFGFTFNGYHSDLTRTIFLGKAPEQFRNMYDIVLACNKYSLKLAKAGIDAGSLHQKAVEFFAKQQRESFFIHGLGHGVGLEVHEEPFFRLNRKTILQPGMAVTIEPGLYFPNEYGIRIEDYVVITKTGVEVLSKNSPKLLIELP
jgi:Xaa-Pro aminopeptidase